MRLRKFYNPLVKWLLRSPLHRFISRNLLLITYTGRKSGKSYTTPVEYFTLDDKLTTFSRQDHIWWQNIQPGTPITLRLRGRDVSATAFADTDHAVTIAAMRSYLSRWPGRARFFGIESTGEMWSADDLAHAAHHYVTITYVLT